MTKGVNPEPAKTEPRPGIARQFQTRGRLWADGVQPPAVAELTFPAQIEHVRVERSDTDRFEFLHDPAVAISAGDRLTARCNPA